MDSYGSKQKLAVVNGVMNFVSRKILGISKLAETTQKRFSSHLATYLLTHFMVQSPS